MRSSELFESLADQAAEHFGITNNPRECGYLLGDGRMLDLSGRHQMLGSDYRRVDGRNVTKRGPDYQNGLRLTDHRDLDELSQKGGTEGMFEFMNETGAIRVMPPIGFCIMTPPTRRQIAMMCSMAKFFDDEIYLECYDDEGYTSHHMSYTDLNPAKVVAFLAKAGLARIA
jgi:hypothetical protein